jgi:hypothetical protein
MVWKCSPQDLIHDSRSLRQKKDGVKLHHAALDIRLTNRGPGSKKKAAMKAILTPLSRCLADSALQRRLKNLLRRVTQRCSESLFDKNYHACGARNQHKLYERHSCTMLQNPFVFTKIQVVANLESNVLGFSGATSEIRAPAANLELESFYDRKYNPLFQSTHSQFSTTTVQVLPTCILAMKLTTSGRFYTCHSSTRGKHDNPEIRKSRDRKFYPKMLAATLRDM